MKRIVGLCALAGFLFSFGGCAANGPTNAGRGALLGGVLGATAGEIIGHQSHSGAAGFLIGGAVGAASGAVIGSRIPEQPPVVIQQAPLVVQRPVVMVPTSPQVVVTANSADSFIVNIPNDNGGYTSVLIKRSGSGFVGPQGEYYFEFPKASQLKAMYAK